jgi:hypothetical protein
MWVGTILHPAVLLTLVDGARILQNRDCPSAQAPGGRSSFERHQHASAPAQTNQHDRLSFPLLTQGRDSELQHCWLFHLFRPAVENGVNRSGLHRTDSYETATSAELADIESLPESTRRSSNSLALCELRHESTQVD